MQVGSGDDGDILSHGGESTPMDVEQFTNNMRKLLTMERNAEEDEVKAIFEEAKKGKGKKWYEQLQKKGIVLLSLSASTCSTISSMKGMYLVTVEANNNQPLPAHKFSVGDEVCILSYSQQLKLSVHSKDQKKTKEENVPNSVQAVVYRTQRTSLTLAMKEIPNDSSLSFSLFNTNLMLVRLSDDVTFVLLLL